MTVFLIRHGSAGTRRNDDPNDLERHLDEVGLVQAERIAAALTGEIELDGLAGLTGVTSLAAVPAPAVARVLSSPAPRCVETVAPLAAALGVEVIATHALIEGNDVESSWDLLESVARADGDAVLCSHGDIIPELIRRARLRGMSVPGKSGCSKGSIWALSWDGELFDNGVYIKNH